MDKAIGCLLGFAFWATVICIAIFVGLPYIYSTLSSPSYPSIDVPASSDTFDCDDSTLFMYNYFTERGYEVQPFAGNLDMDNERLNNQEINHYWLLVNYDGKDNNEWVAYDWGEPYLDEQHYEGYQISYEFLCQCVEYDKKKGEK